MRRAFAYGDKSLEPAVRRVNAMRRAAIVGAGTMGRGIAAELLRKTDLEVLLLDLDPEALQRASQWLSRLWAEEASAGRLRDADVRELQSRTCCCGSAEDLREVDIVWEAATERLEVKRSIFESIERVADPERLAAVFSNTSSHTTGELALLFRTEALRERLLAVHGYYPFESNRLIDVMKGPYASAETFALGVVFADQLLEKTVIALPGDRHGYITDPIFQAMAAIVSWDVGCARDIVELGGIWELFAANPFNVLDRTGHMPYVESARHFAEALPAHDRLRNLYARGGRFVPPWIERLQEAGHTGLASPARRGFFEWPEDQGPPRTVHDPATGRYVPVVEASRKEYWSCYEAAERDRRAGLIKSADAIVHVATAGDAGGRAFRRYVLPVCLYALDLVQDGEATPGQINICTRAGLRYKTGLIEAIDALIAQLTTDGLLEVVRRARDEAGEGPAAELLDTDGLAGPRLGRPCLLHELGRRNFGSLLGYGRHFHTPVSELDPASGAWRPCYPELKFHEPSSRDRVATIVFNNPMRGNVFNKALLDQLDHAFRRALDLHRQGRCGAVLFTAAGSGLRMLGADAREFNRGWFDRERGYVPLSEEQAAEFSRSALSLLRLIQRSPLPTIGVFGEKWGGGAEFSYYLDLRYDLRAGGMVFDPLERTSAWGEKPTYNQPELHYAILPGFGAAGELRRLGLGDSAIFEIFDQGLTAGRAWQLGLSNAVFDDELEALRRGYERARQMAKDPPYSRALFKSELARGIDDEALAREAGGAFNPRKNRYVSAGLLRLLDRGGKPPPIDYAVDGTELPGWRYPAGAPDGGAP